MDQLKEAFQKVKYDIDSIKLELSFLHNYLKEDREKMIEIVELMSKLNQKISLLNLNINNIKSKVEDYSIPSLFSFPNLIPQSSYNPQDNNSTHTPTHNPSNKTNPTHTPTHNTLFNPLNNQNSPISIGNEGVPTDRQTDQQTDVSTDLLVKNVLKNTLNPINDAANILTSLDALKKEIRLKFKRLTEQEIIVFSTIYQLEDEMGYADYKSISDRLKLTESSIRDYVGRLIIKGIPVDKKKLNNKSIQLNISQNLRKIASLPTILQLRDL
ncbi:MAG: hypothetical protein Q7S56_03895 [Nanoarchaeota archaeon]|nr:hypothetical protein [Nanoarchaeota archaeon]